MKIIKVRAYYAIYHAVSAVHALDGKSYKRHKDALGNFNKDYVRTEVFPKDMGRKIAKAEEIRHASDYDDFYIENSWSGGKNPQQHYIFYIFSRQVHVPDVTPQDL